MAEAPTVPYASGLTWASILALIFGVVVVQPAILFLWCTTGQWLSGVSWIVVILWVEIGRVFNYRLSKQELFIMLSLEGFLASTALSPLWVVGQGYERFSPLSVFFGLRNVIPDWFSPPFGSPAFIGRTFFHQDWLAPIAVFSAATALATLSGVALGYFTGQLFVRTQKLPFPMQTAYGEAIVSIGEDMEDRLRVITVTAIVGMSYGLLVYLLPLTSGGQLQILPIPWADITYYFDVFLPGGSFGFHTDLIAFAAGFIVPFNVVVWTLIGSLGVFTFGNFILVKLGLWTTWAPGSNIMFNWQQSFIHFWIGPVVGMSIVGALLPILRHPQTFLASMRGLTRLTSTGQISGMIEAKWVLLLYIGTTGGLVALMAYLVPGIPIAYFAMVIIGFTFIWTVISANAIGLTGRGIVIPYLYQAVLMGSGSREPSIWFVPHVWLSDSGSGWCAAMKLADLTETRFSDYVKAWAIIAVVGTIMGYVYTQMLWTMAEMPSSVYPWLQASWPINTLFHLWWAKLGITGVSYINPFFVAGGAGVVTMLYAVSEVLHLPFSLIGFILGVGLIPPFAVTQFLGAVIGRFALRRLLGMERWDKYVTVIFAGLSIGEGIIITFSAAMTMIMKALWILPY